MAQHIVSSGKSMWFQPIMLLASLLLSLGVITPLGGAEPSEETKISRTPARKTVKIRRVMIIVQPTGALSSQVMEDAVAAELIAADYGVVSREQRGLIMAKQMARPQPTTAPGRTDRDEGSVTDITQVAREAKADAIVTISVLTDVVQRNLFDKDTQRVKEVLSQQVVQGFSLALAEAAGGELLAVGTGRFASAPPVADAAGVVARTVSGMLKEGT